MSAGAIIGGALSLGSEIFGGGGGLRPCEKQAQEGGKQASNVSASTARQAWDAIGHETAREILQFPPQSTFCETGKIDIACSGGFDTDAWRQANGESLKGPAARVLRVAGVSGVDAEGCSEVIQVAKIVLGKWRPSEAGGSRASGTSGGGGGGGAAAAGPLGIPTPVLVGGAVLGAVLLSGR